MTYTLVPDAPFAARADALVIPIAQHDDGKPALSPEFRALDRLLDGLGTAAVTTGGFTGEEHTTFMLLTNGKLSSPRVLLVGAGKKKDRNLLEWQHVVGTATRTLQHAKATRWAFVAPAEFRRAFRTEDLGRMTAKGVRVSSYQFTRYKSDPKAALPVPDAITIGPFTPAEARRFNAGAAEGAIIGAAMNWMRDFGNMPSSDATPTFLAAQAKTLARRDKRLSVHVIERTEMEKLGMGALLGVSRGAATPPTCIVLEWRGAPKQAKTPVPRSSKSGVGWYAFVGKGITFDSGGISIKPGEKMDEMKFDMSGGAAVLGGMKAIAELGIRANIVGIVPATDNLPSGSAYKPGDILTTCRGKTIEVLNTDAEGRIVLADGIGYALRYQPKAIVDLATLTGAIGIALGTHYTGLFANDVQVYKAVAAAAEASGDRCWHMPLGDAYSREVRSDIADLQNLGKAGRLAGAITAAAFLEACAEQQPWAHLDIAYTAWATEQKPWCGKGATGVGVHLMVELAKSWSK